MAANSAARARQQAARAWLRDAGVIPVLSVPSVEAAVEAARALARGGLSAVEVTLRSAVALEAIEAIKRAVPGLRVGAGTVRDATQLEQARTRGADFIVTPGAPPALASALAALSLPVLPGAASATEILALVALGFDAVKLFPATQLGGIGLVHALAGPLPDVALCPTGGIVEAEAADYLRQPNVICIGGSWMLAGEWLAAGRFDAVEAAARRARAIVDARPAPAIPGT